MKLLLYCFIISLLCVPLKNYSQGGTWTWMAGSNYPNAPAVYGTIGVPSLGITPAGAYEAANWTDLEGNLWLMGGCTDSGTSGDLWKYNTITNLWVWVKGSGIANQAGVYGIQGVPSPLNNPSGRCYGSLTWTDTSGDLWLYAGDGFDVAGNFNILGDLWRYHIASNEWTWMNGIDSGGYEALYWVQYGTLGEYCDSCRPGWRDETNSGWVDNANNLWLYGSAGSSVHWTDMWRYEISTNQWIWMHGPPGDVPYGNYGTKGVEDSSNYPPGRSSYTQWKDARGNFYVFGGIEFDGWNVYNDVWRYNIVTNNWTWVAGDSVFGTQGKYGEACMQTGDLEPMGRFENRTAPTIKKTNKFLAYGGTYAYSWATQTLSDLWLFDSESGYWTCLDSNSAVDCAGNYGTFRVSSPSNNPGCRVGHCQWVDQFGYLWLFGSLSAQNDLWRFEPDCSCGSAPYIIPDPLKFQLSADSICRGDTAYLTFGTVTYADIFPFVSLSLDSNVYSIFPDTTTTYFIRAQTAVCGPVDTVSFTIHVLSDSVSIIADKTQFCPGDSVQLCAPFGFTTYKWSNGDTGYCIHTKLAGNYNVTITLGGYCSAQSNTLSLSTYIPPQVSISESGDTLRVLSSGDYQWYYDGHLLQGATSSNFVVYLLGSYTVLVTDSNGCSAMSNPLVISSIANPLEAKIGIYPNPSFGNAWHLTVGNDLIGATAKIFSANGQLVWVFEIDEIETDVVPNVAAGVYFLNINNTAYNITQKLIKL